MQNVTTGSHPRRLRVFVCHSSSDKAAVRSLSGRLRKDGFDPWLDEEALLPGQDWQEEIPQAIRACDAVLVCLSRSSVNKEGYLQKELREALSVAEEKPEDRIFIIPVKLEEVDVPRRLSRWQWADLRRDEGYTQLTNALRLRASQVGPPASSLSVGTNTDGTALREQSRVKANNQSKGILSSRWAQLAGLTIGSAVAVLAGIWFLMGNSKIRRNPKDGLNYVWIQPGTFMMGCSPDDSACGANEKPAHRVRIGAGFWLGQTEVTVAAYKRQVGVPMPPDPRFNVGWRNQEMPIVNESWEDAAAYCQRVGGRLPTEAEWEYAARGGNPAARYGAPDEIAWFSGNSYGRAHEVAQKRPNALGLYDMLGNSSEWVNDWYDEHYFSASQELDPRGPVTRQRDGHVLRGDSWYFPFVPAVPRVSSRHFYWPDFGPSVGFRCVVKEVARF